MGKSGRKNAPRKHARNKRGFSTSEGYGRFNITKPLYQHLGCPECIKFSYYDAETVALTVGDPDGEYIGKVNAKRTTRVIHNKALVRKFYAMFGIKRNDIKVASPFYNAEYTEIDGEKVVLVQIDNF